MPSGLRAGRGRAGTRRSGTMGRVPAGRGEGGRGVEEARHFAEIVLLASVAGLAAILANRLTERLKVPAPLLVLVASAVVAAVVPSVVAPTGGQVESIVTVALVAILLDGGMHIGLRRIREAA